MRKLRHQMRVLCWGTCKKGYFIDKKGLQFVSLEQEEEHQHQPDVKGKDGCRSLRHCGAEKHTMHGVNIEFTTVTKNLIECMTMVDRDSSHGFSFFLCLTEQVPSMLQKCYSLNSRGLEE